VPPSQLQLQSTQTNPLNSTTTGRVLDICASSLYFCLLNSSTNVTCWGRYYNNDYQTVQSTIPAGLTRVASLTCGQNHVCARRQNGRVVCWAYSVIRCGLFSPRLYLLRQGGVLRAAFVLAPLL
jgi:hypothetical protein